MTLLWVLSTVLALVFLASGGMKVFGLAYSVRNRDRFGMSAVLWRTIGVLELAGVAGVLIGMAVPPLGIAAGVGLAMLMVRWDTRRSTAPPSGRCPVWCDR